MKATTRRLLTRTGWAALAVVWAVLALPLVAPFLGPPIDRNCELREEFEAATQRAAQREGLQRGAASMRVLVARDQEVVFSPASLGRLVVDLREAEGAAGVAILRLSTLSLAERADDDTEPLARVTAEIECVGTYETILSFVDRLETHERVLSVRELSIRAAEPGSRSREHTASMRLEIPVYREQYPRPSPEDYRDAYALRDQQPDPLTVERAPLPDWGSTADPMIRRSE